MKTARIKINSVSPYSQSGFKSVEKPDGESHEDFEKRTWLEHGHYTKDGTIYIPPMAMKFAIDEAAKKLGMKVKGKGAARYGNIFKSGIMITEPILLNAKREDFRPNSFMANADGVRGSGKRVQRTYPTLDEWESTFSIYVVDDQITAEILEKHVDYCGKFVGVGQFRPAVGGFFGRFEVVDFELQEE